VVPVWVVLVLVVELEPLALASGPPLVVVVVLVVVVAPASVIPPLVLPPAACGSPSPDLKKLSPSEPEQARDGSAAMSQMARDLMTSL
jgi:hypothetical protein